jgi:hypothetical protein
MQSASKKVALVTGANKGMSMTNSIHKSVRRIGSTLIGATLDVHIAAAEAPVFDFVAAEDVLPKVLTGYGLLPGVVRTSGNTGPWDQPGSARTVHLADGNTAREQVTAYEQPVYFAYRTSDYTFALRYLANSAEGQWWFKKDGSGTQVRWTYTFRGKNWLASIPLALFVQTQWVGYMRTCLRNVERQFRS